MTIDINQFWNLFSESQLVNASQVQALFTEFASAEPKEKHAQSLAKWLVQKKAISNYHAKILASGHSGPFRYGNYTVLELIESGALKDHFVAHHSKTAHPVLLQFMPGTESGHLDRWRQIETFAEKLAQIQHPNVLETYEAVVLKSHRLVVGQLPTGKTFAEKIPQKTRVPWQKACVFAAQIANGLEQLHATDTIYQSLCNKPLAPDSIYLEKSGLVQIHIDLCSKPKSDSEFMATYQAPEVDTGKSIGPLIPAADIYSLGATLYRLISGRDLAKGKTPNLSKFELPAELDSLIEKMIDNDPKERPSGTDTSNLLGLLSGKASELKSLKLPALKTREAYRNSVRQFLPGTESIEVGVVPEVGESQDASQAVSVSERSEARQAKIAAAAAAALNRKKGRWKIPAVIAASLFAMAGAIALFALRANNTVVAISEDEPKSKTEQSVDADPVSKADPNKAIAALPPNLRPTLIQNIVDDNQTSLWESPTNGAPSDFSYLPPNPKILFTFRLAQLDSSEEGQRILKSLGPQFDEQINRFKEQSGLDFENIEQVTISLHTNEAFEYEPYFVVETAQAIEIELLTGYWNRPTSRRLENQEEIFESSDGTLAYYILEREKAEEDKWTSRCRR